MGENTTRFAKKDIAAQEIHAVTDLSALWAVQREYERRFLNPGEIDMGDVRTAYGSLSFFKFFTFQRVSRLNRKPVFLVVFFPLHCGPPVRRPSPHDLYSGMMCGVSLKILER